MSGSYIAGGVNEMDCEHKQGTDSDDSRARVVIFHRANSCHVDCSLSASNLQEGQSSGSQCL